jgi:ankyrin repeat protein
MGIKTSSTTNKQISKPYNPSVINQQQQNLPSAITQPYIIRSRYNHRNQFQLATTDIASRKINTINLTREELQTSYELITKLITTTNKIIQKVKTQNFNADDLSWISNKLIATTAKYDNKKYFFANDFIKDIVDYCNIIKHDDNSKHKLIDFLTTSKSNLASFLQQHEKHNITTKSTPFFLKIANSVIHFFSSYTKKNMLFKAIANKDNSKIEDLLKDIDINIVKNGETLLMCALSHNNIEVVDTLIKAGIDINAYYPNGNTVLMEAMGKYKYEIANKLITYGADLNIVNSQGNSALMLAIACNRPDIVKNLIAHDADVNLVDSQKNSALMIALSYNQLDTAKLLIESNANVELENKDKITALILAQKKGYVDISKMLIDAQNAAQLKRDKTKDLSLASAKNKMKEAILYHDNAKVKNLFENINPLAYGASLLRYALLYNNIEVLDTLVEVGVDINVSCYPNGNTILMQAIAEGNDRFVNKLISCDADIDIVNPQGNSALMLAILHDQLDIANNLIAHNANIDTVNSRGKSALMLAVTYHFYDMAKSLIAHDADINLVDLQKNSALMLALSYNQLDIAKLLIEHNASVHVENIYKETPLTIAATKDFDEIVKILVDTGKTTRLNSANSLLVKKTTADKSIKSKTNRPPIKNTPLMTAIKTHASLEYVEFCVEQGIGTINAQDQDGNTALMIALKSNREDVADLLIGHGANTKLVNKKNELALTIALKNRYFDIINRIPKG